MAFELREKRILLISPEPWNKISVSKHHYAMALAELGNEVFFLGPPGTGYAVHSTNTPSLWLLDYRGFPKGLRFLPKSFQASQIRKEFERLEALSGGSFDVLWSFDNSVFYDMSKIPDRVLRISHIVDLNQDFHLGRAASTAHICFCTSPYIKERLKAHNERSYWIEHGHRPQNSKSRAGVLPGINSVKALYAGNLTIPYLDWELFYSVAKEHHDVDFIFFGPNSEGVNVKRNPKEKWKGQIFELDNVHFPGKVDPEDLKSYYEKADILLLAYREEFLKQVANPHKVMEYMASGKVIVATFTENYKGFGDLIQMTRKNSDFPELFRKTVNSLDRFNAPDKVRARKEAVAEASYEHRIREIECLISGSSSS